MSDDVVEETYELKIGKNRVTGLPNWQTISLDGKLHSPSEEHPALAVFDEQGRLEEVGWFRQNLYHRIDGPALQIFNPDSGIVTYEEYRIHGQMHRPGNEPALIKRDPISGQELTTKFYFNGKDIPPPQDPEP